MVSPTPLDTQRAFDRRRSLVFWWAGAMALVSAAARLAAGERNLELTWELASVVVCLAAALLSRHRLPPVRTLAIGGLSIFFLVSTPVVVLSRDSPTLVVVSLALPLALAIIFIDRVGVVAAVSATGLVVNPLTLARLGWSTTELVHATASMAALYGASILGSSEFRRMRALERAQQESLRRATALQLQSERLVVLGRLAASVGHEINNPLAFVSANARHLEETDAIGGAERKQVWAETRSGLARIAAIVSDLRGLARASPAGVDAVDLERLIRQAARLISLRSSGALQLEVVIEPGLPECLIDEQRLAQVLVNLAVNACDALDESRAKQPRLRFTAARDGDRVAICVEDNGPGIAPDVKPKLFTPFFTTKPAGLGTGLGLLLSREYLASFNGTIACDDSALGGARFVVSVPTAPDDPV